MSSDQPKQFIESGGPEPDQASTSGLGPQSKGYESQVGDHTFASGAKRSEVKPYFSAIPASSLRRLALRATGAPRGEVLTDAETGFQYEGGSRGYGYDNWALGLPMRDTFNHVIEHLYRWKENIEKGIVEKDDHLSAAAWGIMFPLMTFERRYQSDMHPGVAGNQGAINKTRAKARPEPETPRRMKRWFEVSTPEAVRKQIAVLRHDIQEAEIYLQITGR